MKQHKRNMKQPMKIDDIRWVFEGGLGDEFRVSYYKYADSNSSCPETQTFTLVDDHAKGVYLKTEYNKVIFIPFSRIAEVTKIPVKTE
jgi:hypothetical protein